MIIYGGVRSFITKFDDAGHEIHHTHDFGPPVRPPAGGEYGANAVQQSSKEPKKVKGDKTRRQVGDRKFTPSDTIAKKRRAQAEYIKSRSGD